MELLRPQELARGVEVAIGFDQRTLAGHDPGPRAFTERFDELDVDFGHLLALLVTDLTLPRVAG
jgi:hypothetical protein